jgi:hypothetical protein
MVDVCGAHDCGAGEFGVALEDEAVAWRSEA